MRRFAIKFVTVALVLGVNAFADGVIIPDIPLEQTFQFNFRQDFYYGAPIYFRMPYGAYLFQNAIPQGKS